MKHTNVDWWSIGIGDHHRLSIFKVMGRLRLFKPEPEFVSAALMPGGPLQIEDLSATMRLVTFDDRNIKLGKK